MDLKHIVKMQDIQEIPEMLAPAYPSLESYRVSCALRGLSDLQVADLFREGELPPETPIFRGTNKKRYEMQMGELWWTVNLMKASNYSRKKENESPLVLVGCLEDLSGFRNLDYLDDSIFIASQELYRGRYAIRPVFRTERIGLLHIQMLDHFEMAE